jgi:hypothetical protein
MNYTLWPWNIVQIWAHFWEFLGYDFLYSVNTIFSLKHYKGFFYTHRIPEPYPAKYQTKKVASNKLEKGPLGDNVTAMSSSLTHGSGKDC